MKTIPDISFLIPVFNMADTLPDTLESLQRVRQIPMEIIVINDGSSDSVEELLVKWDERFRMIENIHFKVIHQENRGRSGALNEGARQATGRYLSFVDADDLINSDELLKLWECMKSGGKKIVIGQFKVQLESGKQLSKRNLNNRLSAARLVQKIAYSPISPVHLNAFLIDRKYFIQMDGLDPSNLKSEDKDLIIRILRDGVPMEICNSFHYIYRKHELPRSELVVKRAEWFLYRQKMIQKNFSGFTKYSSMVLQGIYDLVKLVYEGLFRYRF